MRILGIDPGSRVTGFGVVEQTGGKLAMVEQGVIRPPRGASFPERLAAIHRSVAEVIERTQPDAVAVESPFSGLNPKSLIQLSHARGVIILAAQEAGLEVHEYSPRSVKKAVVGYGGAEKEQVGRMVQILVSGARGVRMAADASDAVAIAVCHAHSQIPAGRIRLR
jgi:crossover junction endodeoxyribonuclease RuvC